MARGYIDLDGNQTVEKFNIETRKWEKVEIKNE